MKEVWVKKTVWRRYLVEDENVEAVSQILEGDDRGDEIVADCYDTNDDREYDQEEVVTPVQYKIKAI